MISKILRTLVGLSIAAIGTLVPKSATAADYNATWKNYADETFCLGNTSGNQATAGSSLWIHTCNGSLAQTWTDTSYPYLNYELLYTDAAPPPYGGSRCAYTSGQSNGAGVYLEQCNNTAPWAWLPVYAFNDSNGHPCYYFESLYGGGNGGAPPIRVFGVSGGNLADGTHVILWDFLPTHPDQYWCRY
jgi:hypothetical protein